MAAWLGSRTWVSVLLLLFGCTQRTPATKSTTASTGASAVQSAPSAPRSNGVLSPSARARKDKAQMSLRIKISTPLTQYLLTESIPLEVVYENIGPDVAVFREPARTWEVALVTSVDHAQERVDPLGKLFYYRDQDKERRSIEDADDVTLQPNQRYPFVEDVGKRFPQSLGPGRVAVRVFDRSYTPALVSNELTLEVVLGQGSFERLFELAAEAPPPVDPHTQSSEDQNALERRRFAASLIEQFYPDLKLELPAPTLSAESKNQASVRAAKAWWSQHQGSAEVVQKLKQLNGQH